jgi:hypothetical protein
VLRLRPGFLLAQVAVDFVPYELDEIVIAARGEVFSKSNLVFREHQRSAHDSASNNTQGCAAETVANSEATDPDRFVDLKHQRKPENDGFRVE